MDIEKKEKGENVGKVSGKSDKEDSCLEEDCCLKKLEEQSLERTPEPATVKQRLKATSKSASKTTSGSSYSKKMVRGCTVLSTKVSRNKRRRTMH